MSESDLPPEFMRLLQSVTAKRPRIVIDHILEHGFVTTEELRDLYGYNHPPRAARDVRELGIPLETFRTTGSDGRTIGAYRFGDPSAVRRGRLAGRKTFSKAFKSTLFAHQNGQCTVCDSHYAQRYLQVDHRIPYRSGR